MLQAVLSSPNFSRSACPVCGVLFSKCGLPNHIRRHEKSARKNGDRDKTSRRSTAWWDGWKEGYRLGMREGSKAQRLNGVRRKRA